MARTVDTTSTFENWRQNYNDLATDVGGLGSLTTGDKSSIVNAINYVMDQYFYFQDFEYDGSDGATSNTVFSGADNKANTLAYSANKILVFKNGALLKSGTDYTATNGTSVTLASSASNSDVIRITTFTGSYENVGAAASSSSNQWILAGSTIYNENVGGIVLNGDSSVNTSLTTAESIQFDGTNGVFYNDDIYINAVSSTPQELRFRDNDNSHYVGFKAPATISSNVIFTLPTADGSANQTLTTDGSGALSWTSQTANDVTVSANNSTDETVYPVFVDGATGAQGVESDTGLTYNPSSGILTATQFTGALSGNATTATALATSRNFSISGDITASTQGFTGAANVVLSATIDDNVVDAGALNVSGNGSSGQALISDGDGSFSWGAGGKTTEEVQDIAGAMFSSNTETGISATYEDGDGTIDLVIGADVIVNSMIADDAIDSDQIADNSVDAAHLNVSGNGSSGQILSSDGDGSFSWAADGGLTTEQVQDIVGGMFSSNTETRISATYEDGDGTIDLVVDDMTANTNTTYAISCVDGDNSDEEKIRLTAGGSGSGTDDVVLEAGTGLSVARSGDKITFTNTVSDTNTTYSAGTGMSLSGTTFACTVTDTNTVTTNIAGTGVSVSAGTGNSTISIGQAVATSSDVQFDSFGVGTAASGTTGQIRATNDITAYYSSDIALKENINPISNALDKISQIGGYTFDWTDKFIKENGGEDDYFMRKKDTGIIAQEIEEILPEVVATRPNGTKAVKYDKLTPLLIQAIKELKTELDELKSSNS